MAADRAGQTRAVLFDYGLTLVTFAFPRECLLEMLATVRDEVHAASASEGRQVPTALDLLEGILLPIEERLPHMGEDEIDYLDFYRRSWSAAGHDLPADLLYRILDAEQRCWDGAVEPAPGMFHVLHRLRAAGLKTAICSNAPFPPEMMRRQVASLGLAGLLDAVVFSSEVGRRKPAPEPYLAALEVVGAAPSEALFIGDRVLEDYEGPRRLGMRAVLCTALARHPIPPEIPTIASLDEVEACL